MSSSIWKPKKLVHILIGVVSRNLPDEPTYLFGTDVARLLIGNRIVVQGPEERRRTSSHCYERNWDLQLKRSLLNSKGISVIFLISVLFIMIAIAYSFSYLISTKQRSVVFALGSTQAFFLAQTGVEFAIRYATDQTWLTKASLNGLDNVTRNLGSGKFTLDYDRANDKLTSVGEVPNLGKRVVVLSNFSTFVPSLSLGSAGKYVGAALAGAQVAFTIKTSATQVTGDVFVGDCTGHPDLDFKEGSDIYGTIYRHANAQITISGGSVATGGTVDLTADQVSQISTDLNNALLTISSLPATQTLGDITADRTIIGNGGLNVIDVNKIDLGGGEVLTLSGGTSDIFIIRSAQVVKTSNATGVISSDGVGAANVLIVSEGDIVMQGTVDGTYISTGGNIDIDGGTLNGACILLNAAKKMQFRNGATLNFVGFGS